MPIRLAILPLLVLTLLSGCKEKEARTAPPPGDPALVINGETISPLCFLHRSEDENPSYPTTGCEGGEYSVDAENPSPLPAEYHSVNYFYADPATPDEKYPGFAGYKYLGDYRGLMAVLTIENGGGTGTFTMLHLLRLEKDGRLRVVETLAGGDRCNGGITTAFIDGRTLVYDVNLTPYDLLMTANNPGTLQAYDDIDACAICCYGTLRHVNGKAESVILSEDAAARNADTPDEERTTQSCFDEAFAREVKKNTVISLKDLNKFVAGFHKMCTAQ